MRKPKLVKVYVHPLFKSKLFYEAKILKNMNVSDYTRILGESEESLKNNFRRIKMNPPVFEEDTKKNKKGFDFGF